MVKHIAYTNTTYALHVPKEVWKKGRNLVTAFLRVYTSANYQRKEKGKNYYEHE